MEVLTKEPIGKIKAAISEIKEDIKKYSPYPDKVKLISVSKYVNADVLIQALSEGAEIFGENKVQSIRDKKEIFDEKGIKNVKWHFIGNLQSNKVKYIASYIDMIHSVNKLSLCEEIDKQAKHNNRKIDVLLEVNVSREESKEGYLEEELEKELEKLTKLQNINIIGLMTMAPLTDDEKVIRKTFSDLSKLENRLNKDWFGGKLTQLSMGMTNDYKIALEEGATLIRVGSKIFK